MQRARVRGPETLKRHGSFGRNYQLHLMLLPTVLLLLVFNYVPMGGIVIAFQEYRPALGIMRSPFVGLAQFKFLFGYRNFLQVLANTVFFASAKLLLNIAVPFVFSLLLNEIRNAAYRRTVQTMVYLPHFISWVTLAGILLDVLSQQGVVNRLLGVIGVEPIFFLGDTGWFRFVIISSDVWKSFGFNTVIFLATLAGINPELYESARMDGAGRWQQAVHITIPSMMQITIVVATLALSGILSANFDQVFNLYNPLVYSRGDIIDTFVFRIGLLSGQFSLGTAVGLFKSVVGFLLIIVSYRAARRWAGYRIF